MLIFSTQLCELLYCPSNLLSGSPPPPLPPSQCKSKVYIYSVWLGGVGGAEMCWRHILQEYITVFLTRFRNYEISTPPQTKT
jgi:hypothetical protein